MNTCAKTITICFDTIPFTLIPPARRFGSTSGAKYSGVPANVFAYEPEPTVRLKPKSNNFIFPSFVNNIFSGLISRCNIFTAYVYTQLHQYRV